MVCFITNELVCLESTILIQFTLRLLHEKNIKEVLLTAILNSTSTTPILIKTSPNTF